MMNLSVVAILIWLVLPKTTEASIECDSTAICESKIRLGSTCVNGICTNPFSQGCLRQINGPVSYSPRTCNSDDDASVKTSNLCSKSPLAYPEIRIIPANWESPMFYAWIIQIVLSELADVPTSIELSGEGALNFYNTNNSFSYPHTAYNFDGIRVGNQVNDCSITDEPCGHVLPEVWEERQYMWDEALEEGYIEHPSFNGLLARLGFYTPDFVLEEHPELISYVGLSDETYREKIAALFKEPTTWGDYCQFISKSNCQENDGVAVRQPVGKEEEESYFQSSNFIGHFRDTDKNNCTMNPKTCVGSLVDYPCDWAGYAPSQLHWNNIPLESNGSYGGNTYSYSHVLQIFQAANQTRSPVMIYWWAPEPMVDLFEFTRVDFPEPTIECIDHRPSPNRCSINKNGEVKKKTFIEITGDPRGSCDNEYTRTYKIMVSSLRTSTFSTPEAKRSPAYEILQNIFVTKSNFDAMLNDWRSGTDAREAVCKWVNENIDELKRIIPTGYPRKVQVQNIYKSSFLYTCIAFGAFVSLSVMITTAMTFHNKERKKIKNAGFMFLCILLVGFLFVSISAIIYATVPSNASCVARQWIRVIGYTLGLAPLLIKVVAMNKIIQAAERFESVNITRQVLLGYVSLSILIICIFLLIWTLIDPPRREEDMYLMGEKGDVIKTWISCESDSNIWILVVYAWELLQIFCASVLAFQSRGIRDEFNESKELAYLSYTHFFFLMIRTGVYLIPTEELEPSMKEGATSLLLSLDTFTSLCNYFGPKFYAIQKDKNSPVTLQPVKYKFRASITSSTIFRMANFFP